MADVKPAKAEVARGTFRAMLDPHEWATLYTLGVPRSFPRGSVLMFEHDPGDRVMILIAGRVKVWRVEEEGHEVVLSIRDPGDVLGELAFIDGQPRTATVTALERVEALVISEHAFRAHLDRTPRVASALLEVVTKRFRETTEKRSQFAAADTIGRLASRIVELAERYGERSDDCIVIAGLLSQEELGAWAGASRAGVALALRTMRELGWIDTERRRLLVRDLDALRRRAA
jgi:CRP/FNR family transcriptional regulator, cyclic AMP receptor protein